MCGVLGSVSHNKFDYNNGIKSMEHRGPDFNGTFNYKNLTLSHSRLSIIDLDSKSNQPFTIGNHTIVFNGEIYNFLGLKEILVSEGHQFQTDGDTEVLLLWLIHKGIECINEVEGMFAFSWFNKSTNELILCRDSLGIKPIYLYQDDENLIFASEIKSIFALYPNSKKIDKSLIAEYLLNGFIYEPDTGFDKIRQLKPGSYEKYDLQGNLIIAHPALAGKKAQNNELTDFSTTEQKSAGLSDCSESEINLFELLNEKYFSKFNFPFIMAVKERNKDDIIVSFKNRLENSKTVERSNALNEINKIAWLRIKEIYGI